MEALHHLVAIQQLAVEVGDETRRQLSLRVVSLQRQTHGHLHDTVLVGADVEVVQEVLRGHTVIITMIGHPGDLMLY